MCVCVFVRETLYRSVSRQYKCEMGEKFLNILLNLLKPMSNAYVFVAYRLKVPIEEVRLE